MRYNPKAKLKVKQVLDLRQSGAARRINATGRADSADNPRVSQSDAAAEEDMRRWHHLTWRKEYTPGGHIRGQTVAQKNGHFYLRPDAPDSADTVQRRIKLRAEGRAKLGPPKPSAKIPPPRSSGKVSTPSTTQKPKLTEPPKPLQRKKDLPLPRKPEMKVPKPQPNNVEREMPKKKKIKIKRY